jgi:small nuclear ribonucleoprotein (snRNP)-like protein
MTKDEIAKFAYRIAAHNERIVVTLKNNTTYTGHFYNNIKLIDKVDNNWNFVIPASAESKPQAFVLNGEDIESIKKIQLF